MSNTNKLGNPAVIALANSEAISKVLIFTVKALVVGGVGYFIYKKFINRFESYPENKSYPPANITDNQAEAKAETIYQAMKGLGNGFETVKQAIAGINYNAFVKIYNAFGSRIGANPFGSKMTLTEWFNDQFNSEELAQLNFLVPNVFAKTINYENYSKTI